MWAAKNGGGGSSGGGNHATTTLPPPTLPEAVARAVLAAYEALPKTGKPQPHEHTVLAGFAVSLTPAAPPPPPLPDAAPPPPPDPDTPLPVPPLAVVALGTGTKCLGAAAQAADAAAGALLRDGHAEVVARRALLAWVYGELELALLRASSSSAAAVTTDTTIAAAAPAATEGNGSAQQQEPQQAPPACPGSAFFVYCPRRRRFSAAPGLAVHMYVSQPPCGDASVYEPCADSGSLLVETAAAAAAAEGGGGGGDGTATAAAAGRTGAKLITHAAPVEEDGAGAPPSVPSPLPPRVPQASDVERGAQAAGALRRKPGRGDATLSMSCSDKLARWACLGLQGALLAALLDAPLPLATIAVSAPGDDDDAAAAQRLVGALERAVGGRTRAAACARLRPPYAWRPPAAARAPAPAPRLGLAPGGGRATPSGFSVNWSAAAGSAAAVIAAAAAAAAAGPQRAPRVQGTLEVTLSASGRRAGSAKPARVGRGDGSSSNNGSAQPSALPPPPPLSSRSRICSAALAARYAALAAAADASGGGLCAPSPLSEAPAPLPAGGGPSSIKRAADAREAALRMAAAGGDLAGGGGGGQTHAQAWAALRTPPSPFDAWLCKPGAAV